MSSTRSLYDFNECLCGVSPIGRGRHGRDPSSPSGPSARGAASKLRRLAGSRSESLVT